MLAARASTAELARLSAMKGRAERIGDSRELGRARRGLDVALGTCALLPLAACASAPWTAPGVPDLVVRTLAVIWAASLVAFFAGVRRGLTFSEAGGGRASELITMLGVFAVGVVSMVFCSPALAAVGLGAVGVLDAVAATRGETPGYFTEFRPVQMAIAVALLLLIQAKVG